MQITELRDKIAAQAFTMRKAQSRGPMVSQETERMKNILMNNLDEIIEALNVAADAEEKIARLTVEIMSADEELQEKDDEIKELKAAAEKKGPAAKKPAETKADVK